MVCVIDKVITVGNRILNSCSRKVCNWIWEKQQGKGFFSIDRRKAEVILIEEMLATNLPFSDRKQIGHSN